ncbi:MAG: hypothetical protein ACR5LG_08505 [Sodalis sp. (in: enterobacteria)]|uniref:hypothetical protein n=1 Tax=Sodalis sp. (in: enterobacteria) TaxID=1898979 RepID=UPI003F3664B9
MTFIVEGPSDLLFSIADRKVVRLREVLTGDALRVMERQLVAKDRNARIGELLLTDPGGAMNARFLKLMAHLAKDAFFDLHGELNAQLQEVTDSSEIENAYFTMARNRLACALLPLLRKHEHNAVVALAQKWMVNQLTKQLVRLHQGGKRIQVPEVVALAEPTGGACSSRFLTAEFIYGPRMISLRP